MSGSDWIKREKVSCKQWRRNRKKKERDGQKGRMAERQKEKKMIY